LALFAEDAPEKVSQFAMPLKSVHDKNTRLCEQKCIFEHRRKVETIKISL